MAIAIVQEPAGVTAQSASNISKAFTVDSHAPHGHRGTFSRGTPA